MNILLLCDEYPPGRHGGIGTSVRLLAHELVRQGHMVVVTGFYQHSYGGSDHFIDKGVVVYRYRYGFTSRFARERAGARLANAVLRRSGIMQANIAAGLKGYAVFLKDLIMRYNLQVCEMPDFQGYMPFIIRTTYFPTLPVPTIIKLHGTLTYFAREEGKQSKDAVYESERQILLAASATSSVSRYTATQTARYFEYSQPTCILYNGIAPPAISGSVKKKPLEVIFTGTLVAKKGIFQLMKAWNTVHESLPEAVLNVHGKGPTSRIAALLATSAKNSVRFHGHTPHASLLAALSAASVAVFPSYAECFALAPMEAMSVGTAVIYSTRTSGPELITDGLDGLLCNPDNPELLAEKIIFLLRNTHICNALAEKGRESVMRRFAIGEIAAQNISFYNSIL